MTPSENAIGASSAREFDTARRPIPAVEELQDLYRFRDLVWQWCGRNLKLRYKRSVLGVVWTLAEPLLIMSILALVFSQAFRFPVDRFPIYLLAGLLVFDYFNRSTLQIVDEMLESTTLTQRIHVPRSAFAIATILSHMVNWLVASLPLAALMLAFENRFSWALLTAPLIMLLAAAFSLGVGLMVATMGAFFHDIRITYQVLLTGLFYATPIFYPLEIVPDGVKAFLNFNPLLHFVTLYRTAVYEASWPSISQWAVCSLLSAVTLFVGWWVFSSARDAINRQS